MSEVPLDRDKSFVLRSIIDYNSDKLRLAPMGGQWCHLVEMSEEGELILYWGLGRDKVARKFTKEETVNLFMFLQAHLSNQRDRIE